MNLEKYFIELLKIWQSDLEFIQATPIAPDMSQRRYFRIQYRSLDKSLAHRSGTVVAMVYDAITSPEASGDNQISSDIAYKELGRYYAKHHVNVPHYYAEISEPRIFLLEDLGDELLINYAKKNPEGIQSHYQKAIDQIIKIQKSYQYSKEEKEFFFSRSFSQELYFKETLEFLDYVFKDIAQDKDVVRDFEVLLKTFSSLLELKDEGILEKTLVHRDFHSWNLLVQNQEIRVIDFQDSLVGSPSYDLVALLNDRDTDSLLGQENYISLFNYFVQEKYKLLPEGVAHSNGADSKTIETNTFAKLDYEEFKKALSFEYSMSLLQRDFKASGRFGKIVKVRGIEKYQEWIPGTLVRIGRTLGRLEKQTGKSVFKEMLELLTRFSGQVRLGVQTPWEL